MIHPVFTSHHSIGQSILTLETDIFKKINELQPNGTFLPKKTKEIDFKEPVSIFAIAKQYGLKQVTLLDTDISSYWKFYKATKELELQPIYGIKMKVVNNLQDESPNNTESNILIYFKNSQAYYDIIKLYSQVSTKEGRRQADWSMIKKHWTENLLLGFPFYSSFIARNLMFHDHSALPDLGDIKPTFFVQQQGLPFDSIILEATKKWCESNSVPSQEVHQVYYFKEKDVMKHLTVGCIRKIPRTNWNKPNLEHYASDQFSFETYLNKTGGKI